jgi:hemerythrin-like domain-containing protein
LKQNNSEKSSTGPQGSIYSTLKKEHKEVKEMFEQILDDKVPSMKIFNQIMDALQPHMSGEEKYFYPAIKSDDSKEENALIVNEAFEEHKWAKALAAEICKMDEGNEMWIPKVKVLSDMIDHHIEEEEGEVFKAAKKVLSQDQEEEILSKFEQEKKMQK